MEKPLLRWYRHNHIAVLVVKGGYLGVSISCYGIESESTIMRLKAARCRIQNISAIGVSRSLNISRVRSLYVGLIRPLFEYCLGITPTRKKQIEMSMQLEKMALNLSFQVKHIKKFHRARVALGLQALETRRHILGTQLNNTGA